MRRRSLLRVLLVTIYTDAKGRPIPCPEAPPKDASTKDFIAYLRAKAEYQDRVTDIANRAFTEGFSKGLRR